MPLNTVPAAIAPFEAETPSPSNTTKNTALKELPLARREGRLAYTLYVDSWTSPFQDKARAIYAFRKQRAK